MEELEQISIDDVRKLINHLIEKGYDKRIPERRSEQEIKVSYEVSSELVLLTESIKTELIKGSALIEGKTAVLSNLLNDFRSCLQPLLASVISGSRSRRDSTFADCDGLLEALELGPDKGESFLDDHYGAIDSDEEALLYEELDNLMEAQERALLFKGNTAKFMANSFQKLFLRIQELEDSFGLVCCNS